MMDSTQIIATYENMLTVSGQMLEAAKSSDWDRLVDLEKHCRALAERLSAGGASPRLTGQLRQRKVEIIRRMLADDAEIRNLTQPWMAQLQQFLGSARQERKLCQAYAADF